MSQPYQVYISLGSNKGNRFKHLQEAIDLIHVRIGMIKIISKVYNSPAIGFEGDDFYNACLSVETYLKPDKMMEELLAIEKLLGRVRNIVGYEARNIDLDVLLIGGAIIDSEALNVPHVSMHLRRFVLRPLNDIAPNIEHPKLKRQIGDLLKTCSDQSELKEINIWLKNPTKSVSFSNYNFIAIEGNIGAGKTSLATKISHDFNAKLVLERFADNAFLPKFYEDPQRYAFPLEMSFLADRYQQITDDLSQLDLFKDFVVADYHIFKSLIFAKVTLQEDEFRLYKTMFDIIHKEMPKPDLYVYLYQNTDRLLANIKKRGRSYEQEIPADYLEKINRGYLDFIKTQTDLNVLVIDVSELDFVKKQEDYVFLLSEINKKIQ